VVSHASPGPQSFSLTQPHGEAEPGDRHAEPNARPTQLTQAALPLSQAASAVPGAQVPVVPVTMLQQPPLHVWLVALQVVVQTFFVVSQA
jgi:hypothetical protein